MLAGPPYASGREERRPAGPPVVPVRKSVDTLRYKWKISGYDRGSMVDRATSWRLGSAPMKDRFLNYRVGTVVALALAGLVGCVEGEMSEVDGAEESAASEVDTVPRSAEVACKGSTLGASFRTGTGTTVDICLEPDSDFGVAEFGLVDQDSAAVGRSKVAWRCPLDVFLDLADEEEPVPVALLEACPYQENAVEPERPIRYEEPYAVVRPWEDVSRVPRANYCLSGGMSKFEDEQCDEMRTSGRNGIYGPRATYCGTDPYRATKWCRSGLSSYGEQTKKTASSAMGTKGDYGQMHVASCNGATELRARRKNGSSTSWATINEFDIAAGSWGWYWLGNGGTADDDMRFVATSNGNARHRSTGLFCDEKWP